MITTHFPEEELDLYDMYIQSCRKPKALLNKRRIRSETKGSGIFSRDSPVKMVF